MMNVLTSKIVPGEIYSAIFPFSDLSSQKRRPLLILAPPNQDGDVQVGFITSKSVDDKAGLALIDEDFSGEPLKIQSHLRLDKIFNLHLSRIEKRVGVLSHAGVEKAMRKLVLLHASWFSKATGGDRQYLPGKSVVPPSGKVIGEREVSNMVDAVLDGWLTTGRFNEQFEKQLADYLGVQHLLTTNSGSSANLLALTALTSDKLGDRQLKTGDEVITVAAGFPTTVNPILQNNLVPVFVDIDIPTYNIDVSKLEQALTDKTGAVMIAHTLGNPYDLDAVVAFTQKHNLWLVEDCCDALGSTYQGEKVGTFGDIATLSFYPAHHITMGEGGAVFTNNSELKKIVESFRDWGRDCYCQPGCDNTCGNRFSCKLGSLPEGYDHKYTYSHLGYNLKITDMQAACGVAQLEKIDDFVAARKDNFVYLSRKLSSLCDYLVLPEATAGSDPAWFGYPITLKEGSGSTRVDLLKYLDQYKVGSRLLFAGNLTKQPYFEGRNYRVVGGLENTDRVMNQTFWIGIYPGISREMLDYVVSRLERYFGVNW
jgi:CDP-4-dehydro-6-deoxyglucose reductase, E1